MKPVYTLSQIIGRLDSGTAWAQVNVTFSFPATLSADHAGEPDIVGFTALTNAQRAASRLAIQCFDEVVALGFNEVADNAGDIRFHNIDSADKYAFAYLPGASGYQGDVFFDRTYADRDTNDLVHPVRGHHGFSTYLHEIGHALGLNHPGNYDGGSPTYKYDALYLQDSLQYTVMSYFPAAETGADHHYNGAIVQEAETLLLHDIAALHAKYGADAATRASSTVYGFGTTIAGVTPYDFVSNRDPVLCIYDAGGTDTLNFSGFFGRTVLDLNQGAFSDTEFMTRNVSIAHGTIIEQGFGGQGSDLIRGNAVDNLLRGGRGGDRLFGLGGDDTLFGGASDTLRSGISLGSGRLSDFSDDNVTMARAVDISSHFSLGWVEEVANATVVPHVSLLAPLSFTRDYFKVMIANVGSVISLDMDGNMPAADVRLYNPAGRLVAFNNDAAVEDSGSDIAEGEPDAAWSRWDAALSFVVKVAGTYTIAIGATSRSSRDMGTPYQLRVSVDGELPTREILDGGAGNDTLYGEAGDDTLIGGIGLDVLDGGLGDDLFVLADGLDTVADSGGIDTISSTISRSLALYATIENLTLSGAGNLNGAGNALGNILRGNAGRNLLDGGPGSDTLLGYGGNDRLIGGTGADRLSGGGGDDIFAFAAARHSRGTVADTVMDFDDFGNDRLDLSAIVGSALSFRGGAAFTGARQVRINDVAGDDVVVEVNLDANLATVEMAIRLSRTTLVSMTTGDFLL